MSQTKNLDVSECIHSYIYDGNTEETVCTSCGMVCYPTFDEPEEKETELPKINTLDKQGYILSKATELDFSCGGFLSTKIDNRNVDFVGKRVNRPHFNKMRFINNYILSSTGMSTYKNAVWAIASITDKLAVPAHIKERSAEIFKKIYNSKTNIHNSKKVVCACIYYTCMEAGVNRKLEDIATAAEEKTKYASQICKTYQKLMLWLALPSPRHLSLIEEILYMGARMGLPEKVAREAVDIYKTVRERKKIFFGGKSPRITSSLLLYIAALGLCKEDPRVRVNARAFANAAGTGPKGITEYVLKRRALQYMDTPYFAEWKDLKALVD